MNKALAIIFFIIFGIFFFPIAIGICGGMLGIIMGMFGAFFGIIGGVFGAVFGVIGGLFSAIFHGGFIAIIILIVAVLVLKKNERSDYRK